jgi:hypothetical protein
MTYYIGGSLGAVLPGTAWHLAGWPGVAAVVALVQIASGVIALALWREAAPIPAPIEAIRSAAGPRSPAQARR